MKKQFTLLLVFLILAFSMNATIYVKQNASGANNGTSWANAYTDLQSALVDPGVTTNEIWIAATPVTTYKPGTTRASTFNIPSGAKIYGGFNGTETTLSQRDVASNIVILSGEIGSSSLTDNCYHVVTFNNCSAATILDGVNVRYGYANSGAVQDGGGILILADASTNSPQVSQCIIELNTASNSGGGAYIHSMNGGTASPSFTYCSFNSNNSFEYGGGVYVFAQDGTSSPGFLNCAFAGNTATLEIGGLCFEAYGLNGLIQSNMVNCIISGNKSDIGGGIGFVSWNNAECSPFLNFCTITGNNAPNGGGAIDWTSFDGGGICNPTFSNCIIWGNSSLIYNWDVDDPTIDFDYNDIQGSPSTSWDSGAGADGGNNIDTNPYFAASVAPASAPTVGGDFRMHFASEAIEAGTAAYGTPDDFLGNSRNDPPSMGAYEYTPLPGDWNGAIDNDWGNTDNWETAVVATSADDVYLSNKAANMPVISEPSTAPAECKKLELLATTSLIIEPLAALTVHGDLVIDPAAQLKINGDMKEIGSLITMGAVSGEIETERYIGEDEWHLISTPVSGETANLFYGSYLQTYNETTQAWTEIEDENTLLTPMVGYALWGTTVPDTYYTFTGVPGTGNNPINFTSDHAFGWNLFGNPFPSSVDWNQVAIPPGMNDAVYYLEASSGNYVSYVKNVGGSGSRYVPPMQGFWISASAPGTFSLGNTERSHLGTDEYYKNEKVISNYIALQVQSEGMVDKTYIRLNDEATPAFDGKFDAYKLMAPNKIYPQIYTIAGQDKLSISQLPATDIIPVGFYVKNSGSYTISLDEMNDIQSCQLEDLKTGIMQDLQKSPYTFTYTEGEDGNRFLLHLSAASVDFSSAEENIKMYAVGQEVYIKSMNSIEDGTVRITDLAGRTLIEKSISNENFIRLATNLSTGVYIVTVTEPTGLRTEKIIIN